MLNAPPRNLAPRELRVKIPADLDVKIRVTKLVTGLGLSELVSLALEQYLRDIVRDHRRPPPPEGAPEGRAPLGMPTLDYGAPLTPDDEEGEEEAGPGGPSRMAAP